tara:strand:- start:1982 stop:2383 length:402 start_codon:yes stop_codon:yes gene_type:complete
MRKSELQSYIKENIIDILSEEEDMTNLPSKKEIDDTIDSVKKLKKELDSLEEDNDIDDKDAIKAASAAKGKNKKYDLALKGFKEVEKRMKSLARDYSEAKDTKKEDILKQLKKLTGQKNELKSLVDKFANDLV